MENTNNNKDQVFISFRGKDERNKILTHLKQKLIDGNVNVFIDENDTGKPLQNLFKQIRKSRIAIVLFTKNYAESEWCLDELAEIKKCIETEKLNAVIPVFYKVKVSSVKKQSGKFGEKFLALQNSLLVKAGDEKKKKKHVNSRIKRWKKALKVVTGMIGMTYNKNSSELDFVKKIVEKVSKNLAQIAAKEGRNSTPETTKISQRKAANLFVFNVHQLNLNNQFHFSKTLEALSLAGSNLQGNDRIADSKAVSCKFQEEPSGYKTLEPKVPQECTNPGFRRTVSFGTDRDPVCPLPFETVKVQKPVVDRWSIEKIFNSSDGTTCISSLYYCFKLCLCLSSGKKDDPKNSGK